ncbi:MAG: tripartite tricarboxylate transporter substrate-binding protein [Beijerinckiaceae bacterium]
MKISRRLFAIVMGAATLATPVLAQSYPTRAVTMVVPFAAGGATDVIARIVAQGMSTSLGQSVIIENVAGAGGTVGSLKAMNAAADGYTLLVGHMGTHGSSYALYQTPKYDPRSDFHAVGVLASAPIVVFGRANLPAADMKAFAEMLRSKGPEVKVAHSGVGSNAHLTCALLSAIVGAKPTEVPYRGNGPLMNDLLAGVIDYSCDQVITVAPQVASGSVKGLMLAGKQRSPLLPNLPTSAEAGFPEYAADAWTALFAPKNLPEPVAARVQQAYQAALRDPEVVRRLTELGAIVPAAEARGSAALSELVKADVARWAKVIKDANIPLQN